MVKTLAQLEDLLKLMERYRLEAVEIDGVKIQRSAWSNHTYTPTNPPQPHLNDEAEDDDYDPNDEMLYASVD